MTERNCLVGPKELELARKPLGLCHPDDLDAVNRGCPEYYWQTDSFAPRGFAYDSQGELVARIVRDR